MWKGVAMSGQWRERLFSIRKNHGSEQTALIPTSNKKEREQRESYTGKLAFILSRSLPPFVEITEGPHRRHKSKKDKLCINCVSLPTPRR